MIHDPTKIIQETLSETFREYPRSFCEEVALHVILVLQADGYVIAPIAPTEDMIIEGGNDAAQTYEKMIDANPHRLGSDADWDVITSEHRHTQPCPNPGDVA